MHIFPASDLIDQHSSQPAVPIKKLGSSFAGMLVDILLHKIQKNHCGLEKISTGYQCGRTWNIIQQNTGVKYLEWLQIVFISTADQPAVPIKKLGSSFAIFFQGITVTFNNKNLSPT